MGYYPAPGNRLYSTGTPVYVAAYGSVWSSCRHATDARYASQSWFNATDFNVTNTAYRSLGLSVRCVQEFTNYAPQGVNDE